MSSGARKVPQFITNECIIIIPINIIDRETCRLYVASLSLVFINRLRPGSSETGRDEPGFGAEGRRKQEAPREMFPAGESSRTAGESECRGAEGRAASTGQTDPGGGEENPGRFGEGKEKCAGAAEQDRGPAEGNR